MEDDVNCFQLIFILNSNSIFTTHRNAGLQLVGGKVISVYFSNQVSKLREIIVSLKLFCLSKVSDCLSPPGFQVSDLKTLCQ